MSDRLLILGASTRAAAQSAVRAGLQPICADLFADEDLREIAEVLPITGRYPHGLAEAARLAPECPWMYTGALENHPGIIEQISAERPLLGNPAGVVRGVRDPLRVSEALSRSGLSIAAIRTADDPPRPDGCWLLKPLRGAAGRGIVVWDELAGSSRTLGEPHYFQERLLGTSISAVYVAFPNQIVLVGVARQLTNERGREPVSFRYAGSIGPIQPAGAIAREIAATGAALAGTFGLRGLFGCDFVDEGGQVRLTEVNPRYTASVEIYEHAYEVPLLELHLRACERFIEPDTGGEQIDTPHTARRIVGKFIAYAERAVRVPHLGELPGRDADSPVPSLADIPAAGTFVDAGDPICTVLASAASEESCEEALDARLHGLWRVLDAAPGA
jgi:predicted ATP-grasp superfamily ATP-dependent carboligase